MNNFTSGPTQIRINNTYYSSYAAWIAFNAGNHDVHSVAITPATDIADVAKGLYSPVLGSPPALASPSGSKIGALFPGFGMSVNRNPTYWEDGTDNNVDRRPNGNMVIVDGEAVGQYSTPVIDLGDFYRLYGVRIADVMERYPTDVVDADVDDEPNRHNFEYRFSRISSPDCGVQTWRKVERCSAGQICFSTAIQARWVQVRLTLRTDGVEIGT